MREVALPDGRTLTLTGNETPEQLSALKSKLRQTYGLAQQERGRSTLEKGVNLAASAAKGATFALGPKIASGVGSAIAKPVLEGVELLGGPEAPSYEQLYKMGVEKYSAPQQQAAQDMPLSALGAELAGGIVGGVGLAGTKAARAFGALARRGGPIGRIGAGAVAGESAQRVYEAGEAPAGQEGEVLGREGVSMGGVLGGAVPAVGALGRAVAPKVDEGLKATAQLAQKYKIPLSIDQITSGRAIKAAQKVSQDLPFSGQEGFRDKQMAAFNRALLKTVGEDGDKFSRPVIDRAFLNVGKKFDKLTKGKVFPVSDDALDSLSNIQEGVSGGTYGEAGERLFKKYSDDLFARIQDDKLYGDDLVKLRNKFAKISRTGSNIDAQTLAKDMENVLVDMIGESAPAALRDAKHKYKNLIVLEPLLAKVKSGNISPTGLTSRVSRVYGRNFTRGKAGDIGELADIGREILPELGGSDTQARQGVALLAGTAASGFVDPTIALVGGGAMAVNRAIQSGVNRNQAIIGAMTKEARGDFLKLPPTKAQAVLDSIAIDLGLISGMAGAQ